MAKGSKAAYTERQKRKAAHIEDSYESRGLSPDTAEARAWATVNKQDGGGLKGSGGRKAKSPAQRKAARTSSAKNAATTRKKTTAKKSTAKKPAARKTTARTPASVGKVRRGRGG
jgi:hypothetical protein